MNKDGFQFQEWTNPERIQVGTKIIDIIIVKTGLVEMKSLFLVGNRRFSLHHSYQKH